MRTAEWYREMIESLRAMLAEGDSSTAEYLALLIEDFETELQRIENEPQPPLMQ